MLRGLGTTNWITFAFHFKWWDFGCCLYGGNRDMSQYEQAEGNVNNLSISFMKLNWKSIKACEIACFFVFLWYTIKNRREKMVDYRYQTKQEARGFHKDRRAFVIYDNVLEFLPEKNELSHYEYCEAKGISKEKFNSLIRGYFLNGNLVFYKDNFIYDSNLICNALQYVNKIADKLKKKEFNIYFGQIPEQNFKLDFFYGVFKDKKIIKN